MEASIEKIDDTTLVSIIAPMHNLSKFIGSTIESVLAQTYSNFEFILIDDRSSDNTIEIVETYKDDRIKLIKNTTNLGAGGSRNVGVAAARGKYIAFLDGDDLWYPQKLENQISFMRKRLASVVYTRYDIIDSNGTVYANSGAMPNEATYHKLLRHCFIRTSSLIYDIEGVGGKVYFSKIRKRQDFIMFLALIKRVNTAHLLDEITCSYRLHPEGISGKKSKNIKFQWAAYRTEEKLSLPYSAFLMANWFIRAGKVVIKRKIQELINIRISDGNKQQAE
jgi:teichuronic acid biosynthesis glycosyltransferase TuaG